MIETVRGQRIPSLSVSGPISRLPVGDLPPLPGRLGGSKKEVANKLKLNFNLTVEQATGTATPLLVSVSEDREWMTMPDGKR